VQDRLAEAAPGREAGIDVQRVAVTGQAVDQRLLGPLRHRPQRHGGRRGGRDNLGLCAGFRLGGEIAVHLPAAGPSMPHPPAAPG
jgi:hypothetical protein